MKRKWRQSAHVSISSDSSVDEFLPNGTRNSHANSADKCTYSYIFSFHCTILICNVQNPPSGRTDASIRSKMGALFIGGLFHLLQRPTCRYWPTRWRPPPTAQCCALDRAKCLQSDSTSPLPLPPLRTTSFLHSAAREGTHSLRAICELPLLLFLLQLRLRLRLPPFDALTDRSRKWRRRWRHEPRRSLLKHEFPRRHLCLLLRHRHLRLQNSCAPALLSAEAEGRSRCLSRRSLTLI